MAAVAGFYLTDDETICYIDELGVEYRPNSAIDPSYAYQCGMKYVQCSEGIYYFATRHQTVEPAVAPEVAAPEPPPAASSDASLGASEEPNAPAAAAAPDAAPDGSDALAEVSETVVAEATTRPATTSHAQSDEIPAASEAGGGNFIEAVMQQHQSMQCVTRRKKDPRGKGSRASRSRSPVPPPQQNSNEGLPSGKGSKDVPGGKRPSKSRTPPKKKKSFSGNSAPDCGGEKKEKTQDEQKKGMALKKQRSKRDASGSEAKTSNEREEDGEMAQKKENNECKDKPLKKQKSKRDTHSEAQGTTEREDAQGESKEKRHHNKDKPLKKQRSKREAKPAALTDEEKEERLEEERLAKELGIDVEKLRQAKKAARKSSVHAKQGKRHSKCKDKGNTVEEENKEGESVEGREDPAEGGKKRKSSGKKLKQSMSVDATLATTKTTTPPITPERPSLARGQSNGEHAGRPSLAKARSLRNVGERPGLVKGAMSTRNVNRASPRPGRSPMKSKRNLLAPDDSEGKEVDEEDPVEGGKDNESEGTMGKRCTKAPGRGACRSHADRINRRNHIRQIRLNSQAQDCDCDDDDDVSNGDTEVENSEGKATDEEKKDGEGIPLSQAEQPAAAKKIISANLFGLTTMARSAAKLLVGKKVVKTSGDVGKPEPTPNLQEAVKKDVGKPEATEMAAARENTIVSRKSLVTIAGPVTKAAAGASKRGPVTDNKHAPRPSENCTERTRMRGEVEARESLMRYEVNGRICDDLRSSLDLKLEAEDDLLNDAECKSKGNETDLASDPTLDCWK